MVDTNGVSSRLFSRVNAGVWITIISGIIAGSVAYGQLTQEVKSLQRNQDSIDDTIGAVATQVQKQGEALGRLETKSDNIEANQKRVLNTLEKIDDRLDDELRPRNPNPFDRRD